jgi:hypothetical protein
MLDKKSINYVDVCELKYLRNIIAPDDKEGIKMEGQRFSVTSKWNIL